MYHHRGVDILIDAVPEIIKKHPDIEIALVGNGPELENIKNKVSKLKLNSQIKFYGWINHDKISQILSQSSIAIGPLRSTEVTKNALPIKVLEYMSAGLPIIAAKNTLPQDVLEEGKNGFFVKNSKELSVKILELLNNQELRKKMGHNSKEMVKKFDWKNIAELITNEAEQIISLSK